MPTTIWSQCNNKLVLSAPGKVILYGDHSVVYGKRGVAMSLSLRTRLTLTPDNETVTLDLPDVRIRECWSLTAIQKLYNLLGLTNRRTQQCPADLLESPPQLLPESAKIIKDFLCIKESSESQRTHALLSFFHLYTNLLPQVEGFSLFVQSELPTGAGLGSSAAYATCLAGGLLVLSGKVPLRSLRFDCEYKARQSALELASRWAYTSESIMHGNPSGIDNSTCTHGGVITFKSGDCKSIGSCGLRIMLVNTKVPRSTKALLQIVRQKLDNHPSVINPILDSMDAIAEKGLLLIKELTVLQKKEKAVEDGITSVDAVNEGDVGNGTNLQDMASKLACVNSKLGELIDINQSLLSALGVSHPSLERIAQLAAENGLNAKLTGAGGGGFALVLLPQKRKPETFKQCEEGLKALGCQVWMVDLGVPGLLLE